MKSVRMLRDFFQECPEYSPTFWTVLGPEDLKLGIVPGCAIVMKPLHSDPLPPLDGGRRSLLEFVIELFDSVDRMVLLEDLVLFVIEIGNESQGSLTKSGALHK